MDGPPKGFKGRVWSEIITCTGMSRDGFARSPECCSTLSRASRLLRETRTLSTASRTLCRAAWMLSRASKILSGVSRTCSMMRGLAKSSWVSFPSHLFDKTALANESARQAQELAQTVGTGDRWKRNPENGPVGGKKNGSISSGNSNLRVSVVFFG